MTLSLHPRRGEIWTANRGLTLAQDQAGHAPCLVVFAVGPNDPGPKGLVVCIPITTSKTRSASHVEIPRSEGGRLEKSYLKCEEIFSISSDRMLSFSGRVSNETLAACELRVKFLLGKLATN